MKKYLLLALISVIFSGIGNAQRMVIHKDLIQTSTTNTAYKQFALLRYNKVLDNITADKTKVAAAWAVIYQYNNKVLNSLQNIDDAINQGKTMLEIGKKTLKIFSNLTKAGKLAIGKPYLIVYYNESAGVLAGKIEELKEYIDKFVKSHDNAEILINQTTRDEFLWTVFGKINTIYNYSSATVELFKQYNFQTAVNKVVPYQYYKSLDKSIVNRILTQAKDIF